MCIHLNSQDHMVLFMEGRMHLALLLLTAEEKVVVDKYLASMNITMPAFDATIAEAKLRKSIELNSNSIDSYITLAYLLIKLKKYAEAKEVINQGLTVPRVTKSDHIIAQDMEQLKARLP